VISAQARTHSCNAMAQDSGSNSGLEQPAFRSKQSKKGNKMPTAAKELRESKDEFEQKQVKLNCLTGKSTEEFKQEQLNAVQITPKFETENQIDRKKSKRSKTASEQSETGSKEVGESKEKQLTSKVKTENKIDPEKFKRRTETGATNSPKTPPELAPKALSRLVGISCHGSSGLSAPPSVHPPGLTRHQQRQLNRNAFMTPSLNQPGWPESVEKRLMQVAPTSTSRELVTRCLRELRFLAQQHLGYDWSVEPFGSTVNGLCTNTSDLDATCYQRGVDTITDDPHRASFTLVTQLIPLLRQHPQFQIEQEVITARIPLVKLRFEDRLEVDLSCCNPAPLVNTRLLRAYSVIDQRVSELGVAVKLWAKAAKACGAETNNLTSFAYALMVIYFMQVHPDIEMPALPVAPFVEGNQDDMNVHIGVVKTTWSLELSLPQLLLRFYQFYAHDFRWGSEVISIRFGQRFDSDNSNFEGLRGNRSRRIHVEDPYQSERNLHCVLGRSEEMRLRGSLVSALDSIRKGTAPVGLQPTASTDRNDKPASSTSNPNRTVAIGTLLTDSKSPANVDELSITSRGDTGDSTRSGSVHGNASDDERNSLDSNNQTASNEKQSAESCNLGHFDGAALQSYGMRTGSGPQEWQVPQCTFKFSVEDSDAEARIREWL